MSDLTEQQCKPCEGGVEPMSRDESQHALQKLNHWQINDEHTCISKKFEFKNFYRTMVFVNGVAFIANKENHHPDLEVGYNYCNIHFTTHAIQGLSINDFICAAKIDAIEKI